MEKSYEGLNLKIAKAKGDARIAIKYLIKLLKQKREEKP